MLEHLHELLIHFVDTAGYAGLLVVMILGNLAVPVGVEIVLPTTGVLVATGHLDSSLIAIVVAVLGELIGGSILYAVGRYGGPPFVHKFGKFVHLREHELERVHGFYARYGAKTVFLSRFLPVIRGIAALPAGLSEMPWPTFLAYTAAGSAIFCTALVLLGEKLGRNLDTVTPLLNKAALAIPVVVVIALVVYFVRKRREPAA